VFSLATVGEIFVPFARERLADAVLESESDFLFMCDDDMLAPEDLFYQLAAHDKDVIAPLAFTRNPNHHPVIYQEIAGFDPVTNQSFSLPKFVHNYPRNQLVQCDAVGFGAVLIKTDVLKKVPKPWFFGMEGTGEDVAFCYKARKAGFEVWMDTSIKLGHLGAPVVVTEEYSEMWNKLSEPERNKLYGPYRKYAENGSL
jgi:GT2 family glycosyltransferase